MFSSGHVLLTTGASEEITRLLHQYQIQERREIEQSSDLRQKLPEVPELFS
jgi:hypothetical protein